MKLIVSTVVFLFSIILSAQSGAEPEFKKIVEDSFQKIWSGLSTEEIKNYYTDDFILFEDGEIWNIDSVQSAVQSIKLRFESPENKSHKFERVNKFEFLKSYTDENSGWIAYHNHADILMNGTSIAKLHWIETATFIKTNKGWMMNSLHSTIFKEEKNANTKVQD